MGALTALAIACAPEPPREGSRAAGAATPPTGDSTTLAAEAGPASDDDAAAASSASPAPSAGAAALSADSLRGRLTVVGSLPHALLMLRPAGEPAAVRLTGDAAAPLVSLAGMEIMAEGEREREAFRVHRFRVRGSEGLPAMDGILVRDGDGWVIDGGGERVPLASPPPALLEHEGARVWVAGRPGEAPEAFGVIPEAR